MHLLATNVDGPTAQPLRGGLLAAALPPAPGDWDGGVVAWMESTGGWRIAQDCTTDIDDHGTDADPLPVAARPFVIQTVVRSRRSTVAEMSARARRRLDALTGKAIARELWTGAASDLDPYQLAGAGRQDYANPQPAVGDDYVNARLAAAGAEMFTVPQPAMQALGEVEDRLAELVAGGPLYLHVPLALLMELGPSLQPQGELLLTPAGSRVVADAGYPGTDPTGTGRVIYGSGPVVVWTGPITVLDDPSQVVSTSDNTVEVWAERAAMSLFDPQTLVGCPVEA